MKDDAAKIAGAFLIGGMVGAVIALLYAPQSGRQTRRDISKTAHRIQKDAAELVHDTIDTINQFAYETKDRVSDLIEQGGELSEKAKEEVMKTLDHGQKIIEKQKKRIVEGLGL
jgi:gas vesicle protein